MPCTMWVCTSMAIPLHPKHPGWPPWGAEACTQAEMTWQCPGASLPARASGSAGRRAARSNPDLYRCLGKLNEYNRALSMAWEDGAVLPGQQCLAACGGAVVTRAGAGASNRPLPPTVCQQLHPLALLACSGSPASLLKGHRRSQQGCSLPLCLSECEGDAL